MKTLTEEMFDHIAACFTGIWIHSHEHTDALIEFSTLCRENDWDLSSWDICNGVSHGSSADTEQDGSDPLAALKTFAASTDLRTDHR